MRILIEYFVINGELFSVPEEFNEEEYELFMLLIDLYFTPLNETK